MNVQFRQRCLSMLLVLVMLFTMMPAPVIAEEAHDHTHESTETPVVTAEEASTVSEVAELKVSASASMSYMYVEEGPVSVDVAIAGGAAPYTVTLRAVKAGTVVSTDSAAAEGTSARLTYAPASYGDYELVVVVRDALGSEVLTSVSLAVAEHDTESALEWEASVSGASVSANWAASLVSVAKTQVGYAESEKDFIVKSGEKQGYSRYGAWYGTPYASWNNAFIAFVAEYANVPTDALLAGSGYRTWVNGMSAKDAYMPADGSYAPKAGDIAFLSSSRAAIIESVSGSTLTVIEGDVNGAVVRKTYSLSSVKGIGNTGLMMGLYDGSATPVPTQAPEVTAAPDGSVTAAPATAAPTAVPTATVVPEEEGELIFVATPTPGPNTTIAPKDDTASVLDQVAGQSGETVEILDAAATNVPLVFSDAYYLMQDELKALYAKYLGEGKKTPAEIKAFVEGLELGDLYYAMIEVESLAEYAVSVGLTDYEARALYEVEGGFSRFAEMVDERWLDLTVGRATTVEVLDGQITVTDSVGNGAVSNGVVTIKATGSLFSKATNTITIANETTNKAQISFDYSASTYNTFTIDDASVSASGTYSVLLDPAASLTIVLKSNSGFSNLTATLTLSNFSLTAAATSSNVTFEYDSSLGSVTVNGTTVESGTTQEVTLADGAALVAAANSNATFHGWVNADGAILSTAASYTLTPSADMTVKAMFTVDGGTPYFMVGGATQKSVSSGLFGWSSISFYVVGGTHIFDNLNDAIDAAAASSAAKAIVLLNSGTLTAGTYTIPSGVTLLIPFDSANTMYTTQVQNTGTYTAPTAYRTLTMASGANLVINGAMSVSAMQKYANGGAANGGAPTGKVGFVKMNSGSNITVNSGGVLYAYGFITGSGSVTANSGASVYEMFQISDFRGGTQSTDMENGVFPISQYYVQNIEVPLTLHSGSKEYSYTTIYMSSADFGSSVAFIAGSGAMFNLTSGYVVKDYDEASDRLIVESYGNMSVDAIELDIGGTGINSANYELPVNSNITVKVNSGSITINQDLALLPGSKIIIGAGATCTLGTQKNVYVYDADQWGTYCGSTNKTFIPVAYAPGKTYTRTAADLVDAAIEVNGTMDASVGYLYTTTGGANIYSTGAGVAKILAGTQTVTYQLVQNTGYTEIPLTVAKLKNADGTFEQAATATYNYVDGKWVPDCGDNHTEETIPAVAATCESTGLSAGTKCSVCGEIITEQTVVDALGHSWDAGVVTTEPGCTTEGVKTYTCQNDNSHTYTEAVSATGHTTVTDVAKDATCTETGLTEGSHCSVCDEVFVAQQTVPALGHTPGAAATCTTAQTCTVCGAELAAAKGHTPGEEATCTDAQTCTVCGDQIAAALGHTPGAEATCTTEQTCTVCGEVLAAKTEHNTTTVPAQEPTCNAVGWYEYVKCNDCDYSTYAENVRDADPSKHNSNTELPRVEPTCTETGLGIGFACSVCGEQQGEREVIEALGHSMSAATCTEPATCQREGCGYTDGEALGHTEVTDAAVDATCTTDGKTEGKHCSVCNEVLVAQETVPSSGHTPGEEATCTADQTCTVCGEVLAAAKGHTPGEEATCTADQTCTVCGEVLTAAKGHTPGEEATCTDAQTCTVCGTELAAALGHTPGEEATCTDAQTCTVCGTELAAALGHTPGEEATCTTAQTCTKCGDELVAAKGHTPGTAATCTDAQTCTVCGEVLAAALGHTPGAEATCTDAQTCTVCGEVLTAAKGHTPGAEATCTTAQTCTACGDELVAAKGHTPGVEATCTDAQTCTACGEELAAKLPHTEETIPGKAATCTETGLTQGKKCSVCGEVLVKQTEISMVAHTLQSVSAKEPTCEAIGWDAYERCTVCTYTTYAELPATGHNYVGKVTTEPTCTETGVMTYTCQNDASHSYPEEIAANGHTLTNVEAKAATCEEIGWNAYEYCSKCDYTTYEEIPALDHDYTSEVTTEPTCEGKGVVTYTCQNDPNHVKTEEIDPKGHSYESEVTTKPTCTATGVRTYTCTACGNAYTETVAELGHTWVYSDAVEPTCDEDGYAAGRECSVCHVTEGATVMPATGHDYTSEVTTQPTCTTKGVRTYTCQNDASHTHTEEIAALDHNYTSEVTTQPTCTTKGVRTYTCQNNASHTYTEEIPALDHNYTSEVTTQPTCTATGVRTYTCQNDKSHTYTEEIAATGHDLTKVEAKAATCEAIGWNAYEYCSVCDHTTYVEIPATDHNYVGKVTTEPGCTTAGVKTYTCENDPSHSYTEPVSPTGHNVVTDEAVAATCTTTGLTEGNHCSVCGTVFTAQAVIPVKGHNYVGVVTTEPTCTEKGVMTYTCKNDASHTYTEALKENGHTLTKVEAKVATCEAIGWNAYEYCSVCDYTTYEEIPVKGHNYVGVVTTEPTCTEKGVKTYTCQNDASHTYTEEIAATGHDLAKVEAKAATCEAIGWNAYEYCSACDYTTYEELPVTGHTIVTDAAVAATCTTTGLTEGKHCSACGKVFVEQKEIAALTHNYVGVVTTEPTCTEKGVKTYTCKNDASHTYTEEIKETGHSLTKVEAQTVTCETIGWDAYEYCSACDYTTYVEIAALTHSYVGEVTTEPTCEEPGVKTYTCKNDPTHTYTEEIAATGHTLTKVEAQAVTCEAIGWDAYEYCSVCDYSTYKEIDALGHKYAEKVTTEPTCEEPGVKTYTCEHDASHTYTEDVAATGHSLTQVEAQEATCEEIGWDAYEYCSVCDYTTYVELPANGHNVVTDEAVAPTCTEPGKTEGSHCDVCNELLLEQEEVAALDHAWDEGQVTTPNSCTTAGEMTYTCQREGCGETKTEPIFAAHTPVVDEALAPTCTEPGLTEGSHCEVCGETIVAQQTIPAAHTWEEVETITAATCTTEGKMSVRCTVPDCGETDTIVIPALGHTEVVVPAVDVTCETDGLTEGKHCTVCGTDTVPQEVIPHGHKWSTPPCTDGEAVCERCGATNTELLDHDMAPATCLAPATCKYGCGYTEGAKLPHTVVVDEEIPPMCEDVGYKAGTHCSVCGTVIIEPEEVEALGHDIKQYEAKRATYTSPGWEAYEACTRCAYSTKVEIPVLDPPVIASYEEFMANLPLLEQLAVEYAKEHPETEPVSLIIKYIRTGVDRYNSGSWGIMAGYEDAGFAKYVSEMEDTINSSVEDESQMIKVSGLKNLENFALPNGDVTDIGHMFGTMDITYSNPNSQNHADVGGWTGDLVDLLSTADLHEVESITGGEFEDMVTMISDELLCKDFPHSDIFSQTDMYGDLDAYYVMKNLDAANYEAGDMSNLFTSYFTTELTDEYRAKYLLDNRLNGVSTRSAVREEVYNAYTSNNVISTLEGTRDFVNTTDLNALRKAVCYSFADYLCRLAGDYVDVTENPYLTVFESQHSTLAPGITMEIHKATSADNKQMVYYLAYADIASSNVDVLASYQSRTPTSWGMSRVIDQANNVQTLYGDPESEEYIENFNVITAINGAGFNMATGEPGGLLVMNGVEYHPADANGFFGITKSGYAVIGSTEKYYAMQDQIQEGIAGFGTMLVQNGELAITATSNYYTSRASRTAVGITKSGKVVFMVLDGRQEPWSCGGSMIEIAQIMLNAGCVTAINLDGGGSTTFVARQVGDEELSVVNRPSDGVSRSVSTALLMVSTAPSSTAFDHALVESDYSYLTVDTSIQMTATGVSATNNVVDLPEGTTWAVSDERWGMITEDGVFTALRNGSVDVYLMLDDVILGQKTLNIVVPDQLYFTKDKIDSVYGASIQLPLKARYEGKEVAISASDISFTLSNDTAGEMQGFFFVAATESTIKTVTITAALASNSAITAEIDVVLYKQGENSFDFDQATGGSRILAWQRTVSNSNTADDSIYYVVDPDEDMVTSYIIALDMTQIPIPDRLADLTYMLPGADMEGASAWGFLLQLAERISVLTEVKPQITFDPNFDVDYSEIKLINDYFVLNGTDFDEATNTLTLTLNWIDQTAPIPAESANPMCIVNGLKITPKEDAAWDEKDRLIPVNSGSISYTIYMRANALYSFSQKAENQETFGLYPFVNPNDESEKGGYFKDTYTEFSDTYTLVRALKNGWYTEDGGFRYYVNGVYHTGVMEAEGLYYDFGTDGVNAGQKTYTGLHVMDGNTYYIQMGLIKTGWHTVNGEWYFFDYGTGIGANGIRNSGTKGVDYEFENGRLLHGVWLKDDVGYQYYYGPEHYYIGWKTIDGEQYFFEDYYVKTGILPVQESHDLVKYWYEFTDTGVYLGYAPDGLYWYEGELYYVVNGVAKSDGLNEVDGYYYYFQWDGAARRNQSFWISSTNGLPLKVGRYRFDELGRIIMTTEIVNEEGTLYYYQDGCCADSAGVVEFEGHYYYVSGGGIAITNQSFWITKTNDLVPAGKYRFDENGHMLMDTAIVEEDGALYYYQDGMLTYGAGLVLVDGDYYYINGSAQAVTDTTMYVSKTNNLLKKGTYTFGPDGKLVFETKLNGIVNGYYYVDGVPTEAGLLLIDGAYYYAGENGKIVTDQSYAITDTNDLLDVGTYRFDEDGKIIMTTELVDEDGELTYYEDGKLAEGAGLILYEGDYYYITEDGTAVVNTTMLVEKTNDLLPEDTYSFGADGKLFERLAGDADDNGVVDLFDALAVLKYDSGEDVVINILNADVNADQVADIHDALLIMQYDSGWDVTLK